MANNPLNFVSALKRPFADMKTFIIGAILGMIPLLNLAVIGYTMESTKDRNSLPEWKNFGALFMKGLSVVIIGILLFAPAAAVLLGTLGTVIVSPAVSMVFGGLPAETCDSIMAGNITDLQMEDWIAQNYMDFIPLFVNATPLLMFGGLLAAIALYIMPAAIMAWLKEDRIGAAFSMKVVESTLNLDYLVNWLIIGYLGGVVSSVAGWIPFVGTGITMYVSGVFSYTAFAELLDQ